MADSVTYSYRCDRLPLSNALATNQHTPMTCTPGSCGDCWSQTTKRVLLVVVQGGDIILLLPRDEHGVLGPQALQLSAPPPGLRTQQLLQSVHEWYQTQVPVEEQLTLMRCHPGIRRALQVRVPERMWYHRPENPEACSKSDCLQHGQAGTHTAPQCCTATPCTTPPDSKAPPASKAQASAQDAPDAPYMFLLCLLRCSRPSWLGRPSLARSCWGAGWRGAPSGDVCATTPCPCTCCS